MSAYDVVDQSAVLKELGISPATPGAKTIAEKVTNDHLVLDRAMKLLLAEKVPQVLAEMTPAERDKLAKRTGPTPAPKLDVKWYVGKTDTSGEWYISAIADRGTFRVGQLYFRPTAERAKLVKAYGETVPEAVAAEYARVWNPWLGSDSPQSHLYASLRAPTPAPDTTVCPGPGFAGVSKRK